MRVSIHAIVVLTADLCLTAAKRSTIMYSIRMKY